MAFAILIFSEGFDRNNIKTDLNQMNDNLNEKSIQNALDVMTPGLL